MSENAPVYGCFGCSSTGGRASCPIHGGPAASLYYGQGVYPVGSVVALEAEVERLQGLLADADREFNAENLRAEALEARVEKLGGTVDAQVVSIERLQVRVKELEAENKKLRGEIEWFFGKDSKFPHLCPEREGE